MAAGSAFRLSPFTLGRLFGVAVAGLVALVLAAIPPHVGYELGRATRAVFRADLPPVRRVCEIAAEAVVLNDRRSGGAHCAGDLGGPWAGRQE